MSLNRLSKQEADKLKHRASVASIALSGMLSLLKLGAAFYSGSLAVLSSMIDSLSDILASAITFVAIKFSAKPASEMHRYGYGKAEAVSALFQAAFIAGSGLFVMYDSLTRLMQPRALEQTGLAIAIMVISLVSTLFLISYQKHVAKVTESQAINADSEHYVVDILTNASIILSLTVVKLFDIDWFDTLTAFVIAVYLLINAYRLACEAINLLLDHELDDDIRDNIKKIVSAHKEVKGMHDLRTRSLGNEYMFELHLELDGGQTLYQAHEISDAVEQTLIKAYPNAQIIIHQDPAGIKEHRLDNQLTRRRKAKK